ncbi:BREX system Lon protease-like protein BrxL [Nostoc sp. CALU 1950]|uniref:BREX system Lon protease-like protein BrxL n=1 Tax=Nostoc sp. CALU 1950 TaxID=3104321 RepID=UPI003EB91AE1
MNARKSLDEKVLAHLSDRVVLKPLTRWNDAYKEFPRYVMEYLCARYVDPADPSIGQHKIDRLLNEHYVGSEGKELIKSRIKEKGEYTILGQFQVRLDATRDHYWAEVPAIGESYVRVSPSILHKFSDVLLTCGAWGTAVLEYDSTYELGRKKYPFYIKQFTPFQVTRLDLDDYIEKRRLFTTNEWIDLIITSIGFEPERFNEREKYLMLLRLVPFVEANYNLIELGPRETGKTYTYRNTSSHSFVLSGSRATPATLFFNQNTRKVGVLGQKDVVFFDEIAHTEFSNAASTISVLKDYMQTGRFSRGSDEYNAQASIVLGGNIDTDIKNKKPIVSYKHFFSVLPVDLQDTAFLDRIHAFLPGWEMPKIRTENYAQGYGFITDYLAEIFNRLRRTNYSISIEKYAKIEGLTSRNQTAIKKTAAGLLKLIYPHQDIDSIQYEEYSLCIRHAIEHRSRVIDQLAIMAPEEFSSNSLVSILNF